MKTKSKKEAVRNAFVIAAVSSFIVGNLTGAHPFVIVYVIVYIAMRPSTCCTSCRGEGEIQSQQGPIESSRTCEECGGRGKGNQGNGKEPVANDIRTAGVWLWSMGGYIAYIVIARLLVPYFANLGVS